MKALTVHLDPDSIRETFADLCRQREAGEEHLHPYFERALTRAGFLLELVMDAERGRRMVQGSRA